MMDVKSWKESLIEDIQNIPDNAVTASVEAKYGDGKKGAFVTYTGQTYKEQKELEPGVGGPELP